MAILLLRVFTGALLINHGFEKLNDINNFVRDYLFIESHILNQKNNEVNIKIQIKKAFALNNFTNEVIFIDNTKKINHYT